MLGFVTCIACWRYELFVSIGGVVFSMEEWCFIGAALHLMAAVFASSVYRVPGVGCVVR